jgi:hypothetical protein
MRAFEARPGRPVCSTKCRPDGRGVPASNMAANSSDGASPNGLFDPVRRGDRRQCRRQPKPTQDACLHRRRSLGVAGQMRSPSLRLASRSAPESLPGSLQLPSVSADRRGRGGCAGRHQPPRAVSSPCFTAPPRAPDVRAAAHEARDRTASGPVRSGSCERGVPANARLRNSGVLEGRVPQTNARPPTPRRRRRQNRQSGVAKPDRAGDARCGVAFT